MALLSLIAAFLLLVSYTAAAPSSGCKTAKYHPVRDHYISAIGNGRRIGMSMPRRYNPRRATPLVLAFHDKNQSPEELMWDTLMSNQFVNEEAIIAYPNSIDVSIEERSRKL
jgi:poly(3-hydroxybutyrate) depolymerase